MRRATERFFCDFAGADAPPLASAEAGGPFVYKLTKTAGSPSALPVTGITHSLRLLLDSTSEEQVVTVDQNDILQFRANDLLSVAFRAKASAIAANQGLVLGLSSAENDTPGSVAKYVWFRLNASTSILAETNDGTTAITGTSTGQVLSADVFTEFVIDFSEGLNDVRFSCSSSGSSSGNLMRVANKTLFACPGLSGQFLQPMLQLQKASGTGTPHLDVDYVEIEYRRS
jgi:hypothetical protein